MRTNGLVILSVVLINACSASTPLPGQVYRAVKGPLRVHPSNHRYFTDGTQAADGSLRTVYLTGSHTWTNLIDRGPANPPPKFDFDAYLDLLQKHNHTFIRLWGRQISWYQKYGDQELYAGPLAWERTGPGKALDGLPKFDLTKLSPEYFERLRARTRAAGDRGIYVAIMFFGGHAEAGPNWTGSPFHRDNNINGIDGDPNKDGSGWEMHTLSEIPRPVADVQKAYIRKVIDTVNDLDNVLYEVSNEAGETSKEWQYDLIRFVREYQKNKPRQHPVGMTAGFWPVVENRAILDASPADWVSYQFEMKPSKGQEEYNPNDPFIADGKKVNVQDSDHWWVKELYRDAAFGRAWVWKSFCRGHNPILMEHLPPLSFVDRDYPLSLDDPGYAASRVAMGHTRQYAQRMNLAKMTPSKEIASTGYCLANRGQEYLIYLPKGGAMTVDLSDATGQFIVEWFDPVKAEARRADLVRGGRRLSFQSPFQHDAVLYLRTSK